ncbi:hypothetical protein AAH027_21460 [Bacteroides ovatus]
MEWINEKVDQMLDKICDRCDIKSRVTWRTAYISYAPRRLINIFTNS